MESISVSTLSAFTLLTAFSAPNFPILLLKSALISNWSKYFLEVFSSAVVNSFLTDFNSLFSFLSLGITVFVK